MNRTKLSPSEIEARLSALNATIPAPWTLMDGQLHKTFDFPDFNAAFGFMTRCALAAEAMDHHPDWDNSYGRVHIALSTHAVAGITDLDFVLATRVEAIANAT
jgi:4a-hydroxytetrahydrobiopterin dehydratase